MEPQTEITISPEQKQAEPPKNNFNPILSSPRFWLALVLPCIGTYFGLASSFENGSNQLWKLIIFPTVISFSVNFFLPFTTNFIRVIYLSAPILFIAIIWDFIGPPTSDPGLNIYFYWLPLIILLALINLFGWLGAKVGIARGHKV